MKIHACFYENASADSSYKIKDPTRVQQGSNKGPKRVQHGSNKGPTRVRQWCNKGSNRQKKLLGEILVLKVAIEDFIDCISLPLFKRHFDIFSQRTFIGNAKNH